MKEVIFCECQSSEHQVIFGTIDYTTEELARYYPNIEVQNEMQDEVFVHIHLSKKSFWYRIKYAFKYIFGYQCKYGAFDEVLTTKTRLKEIINKL